MANQKVDLKFTLGEKKFETAGLCGILIMWQIMIIKFLNKVHVNNEIYLDIYSKYPPLGLVPIGECL